MIIAPVQPGSECSECRAVNRMAEAKRTITTDKGQQWHLCLNHAAVYVHRHDIYDQAMNPKGKQ